MSVNVPPLLTRLFSSVLHVARDVGFFRRGILFRLSNGEPVPIDPNDAIKFFGQMFREKAGATICVDEKRAAFGDEIVHVFAQLFGEAVIRLGKNPAPGLRAQGVMPVARMRRTQSSQSFIHFRLRDGTNFDIEKFVFVASIKSDDAIFAMHGDAITVGIRLG